MVLFNWFSTGSQPATTSEQLLSLKTLFLVAITSVRRASELAALHVHPPFLQFHPLKVTLYLDVTFLPKVVTDFHVSQPIILQSYFPSSSMDTERCLHSLDVRRALAFYVSRFESYRQNNHLFVSFATPNFSLTYELARTPLPCQPRAHSTRAVSTSTAFLRSIPLPDICRAATIA